MKYLLVLLLLCGCGNWKVVDPEIKPYIDRFEKLSGLDVTVGATFTILEKPVAGRCIQQFHKRYIKIDRRYWLTASDIDREIVVFHELGHCALFRDHRNDVFEDGRPISIMNELLLLDIEYKPYREDYIEELLNYD